MRVVARHIDERGNVSELEGDSDDPAFWPHALGFVQGLAAKVPVGEPALRTVARKRSGKAVKAEQAAGRVVELIEAVRPQSSMEAATIFAYVAVELGWRGLNKAAAIDWADAVGWDQPADWSGTFTNARRELLLRNVGRDAWVPTEDGEAFVVEGVLFDAQRKAARRRGAR